MKKSLILILGIAITSCLGAQAPNKISYQSVVRNSSGQLVANSNVGVRISIIKDLANGTTVYSETHTKTSNANGLISLEIGGGTVISGSFSAIDWSTGSYFLKTETDPTGGANYSVTGTTQLLSVPYALFAKTAGNTSPNYWIPNANGIYYDQGSVGIGTSLTDPYIPLTVYASKINGSGNAVLHLKSEDTYHTALSMFNGVGTSAKEYSFVLTGPSNTTAVPGTFGLFNHTSVSWSFNFNLANNNMAIGSNGFNANVAKSKLHVFNGDVNIDQIGSGIIMKSPNGNCWRITIDNSGNLIRTSISCP